MQVEHLKRLLYADGDDDEFQRVEQLQGLEKRIEDRFEKDSVGEEAALASERLWL